MTLKKPNKPTTRKPSERKPAPKKRPSPRKAAQASADRAGIPSEDKYRPASEAAPMSRRPRDSEIQSGRSSPRPDPTARGRRPKPAARDELPQQRSAARPERSARPERPERAAKAETFAARSENAERPRYPEKTRRPMRGDVESLPASWSEKTRLADRSERRPNRTEAPERTREYHIWGRRPVEAFLADSAGQAEVAAITVHLIHDKQGKVPSQLRNIVELADAIGAKIKLYPSEEAPWPMQSDEPVNHQRVCMSTPNFKTRDFREAIQDVKDFVAEGKTGCVGMVLDQIQDPRNFGAIIRSAAFFGAKFVIIGQDRQSELTPLVVRTSAGGAFGTKVITVVNLSRALDQLNKVGAWAIGAAVDSKDDLAKVKIDRPFILVLGNEGKGIRKEVTKHCDMTFKIQGGGLSVDSLNVGVAAGVALAHLAPREKR